VNQNIFDSKMISSTAMVTLTPIMALTAPTQPLDALLFGTSSIPMALAYQAALTPIEMNGTMDLISATLLALANTMTVRKRLVLTLVNQNTFDSVMISFTAMDNLVQITALIVLIRQQDALISMTLNISMAHVCQVVPSHLMQHLPKKATSAMLLVLQDIIILWRRHALTHANLITLGLKMMFFIVMINRRTMTALLVLATNISMVHVSQIVIIHTETNIMKESTNVIPLVKTDTLMK
jgi:hypothetical protein